LSPEKRANTPSSNTINFYGYYSAALSIPACFAIAMKVPLLSSLLCIGTTTLIFVKEL
jgi:purine-cytosine permease-like protein